MHIARLLRPARTAAAVLAALVSLSVAPVSAGLIETGPEAMVYIVEPGDNLSVICARVRGATGHFGLTDLLQDIRRANDLGAGPLRIGQRLTIPIAKEDRGPRVSRRVAAGAPVRGIYLSGPAAGVSAVTARVDRFVSAGGNTVVLDAKDIDGALNYRSEHPWAGWGPGRNAPLIPSLAYLLERFQRQGLHVVVRLAVFLDGRLGAERPELVLRDVAGQPILEQGCAWVDPALPQVRLYNLALIAELARAGVDEVQLDYVRYPTTLLIGRDPAGGVHGPRAEERHAVITGFVRAARDTLARYGTGLSAAVFGIIAWDNQADLDRTGQDLPELAGLVDAVYPMVYPSHFEPGFAGLDRPADSPGPVVAAAVARCRERTPPGTTIRPWLQAFPYRVHGFGPDYLALQMAGAEEAGADGWCFWNPSCRYGTLVEAMQADQAGGGSVVAARPASPDILP